jgi:hypothetical protein
MSSISQYFYAASLFLVLIAAPSAESEQSVSQEIALDHFKKRVKTTEGFIKYAATKSSMSGKPYMVRCDGREMSNADWLNRELQKLRNRS